jgi:SSS family solute:Na+ symporter
MSILIIVLLYEIISIGGVCLWLVSRNKKKLKLEAEGGDSFVTSNRDLPTAIIGVSLALAVLGAVHVFGIMEMAWGMGAAAIWFSLAHVVLLCVVCLCTGRWVRRLKVSTVPEMLKRLFGERLALVCTCVIAAATFGILTMEVQALGIIFNTLTFNQVPIQWGAVIGGAIGIFYVIIAGMKEIGWVNLINTIIMYLGLIVAMIYLSGILPGGWQAVENHYATTGQPEMTSLFGGPGVFVSFGIANIIAVTFAQGISQMGLQSAMAAKNEKTIVKALWIAAPVNGLFGVFTVGIGLAAKSLVETGQLALANPDMAAKTAGATMLVNYLPTWLVAWLLAAFLGAVLSTFAITTMGIGALFSRNIYLLKYPNASAEQQTKMIRIFIVLSGLVAMAISSFLPTIVNGAVWTFSWLVPVFWCVVYAMFWKRSAKAVGITFAVAWILVLLWTYTPVPSALGLAGVPVPYVTLAVSFVVGIIAHALLPGEPGYFKSRKAKAA